MIFVRSSYTRLTVLWRLLVLWSSWSNREFHEERGARGPVGSRASQGVNYARKQYYRTNYRTGERNSVKCRAAHYQPLPRECAPRYKLFRRGWPIGRIQRGPLSFLFSFFALFFILFLFNFFFFFNFIPPFLPLYRESRTKLWPRFSTDWKIFFRSWLRVRYYTK